MDDGDMPRGPEPGPGSTSRELAGMAPDAPGMAGSTGPAETTESVGDPDASSERSATEGGTAAGAVIGALVGGPIGLAVGAAVGSVAGAAAGPDEPVMQPGDERVDGRADREAAYVDGRGASPTTPIRRSNHDPLLEEHAVDIPVVDALTGHGEAAAEHDPGRPRTSGGTRP